MNCIGGTESFPSWNNKVKSLGIRVPEFLPAVSSVQLKLNSFFSIISLIALLILFIEVLLKCIKPRLRAI